MKMISVKDFIVMRYAPDGGAVYMLNINSFTNRWSILLVAAKMKFNIPYWLFRFSMDFLDDIAFAHRYSSNHSFGFLRYENKLRRKY